MGESVKERATVSAVLSFSKSEGDKRFAPCVIRIAHAGLNRNKSVISKEVFERCAKTAYGCPIVCNYDLEDDAIGGHDKALVRGEDGIRFVNLTHPVGFVPEGAAIRWESVEEDGSSKEYLCVDALLWRREAAFAHIEKCGRVDQSMEIEIGFNDFTRENGVAVVNAFTFQAFCLLERDEPAMRSACIELFSRSDFMEQFSLMLGEARQYFAERRDGMSVEKIQAPGTEVPAEAPAEAVPAQAFSLDAGAMREELGKLVAAFGTCPDHPDWPRFYVMDFDPAAQEVFAYDYADTCFCGFKYTVSGDNIAVLRDTYAKKKQKYVDWEDGAARGGATCFASVFDDFAESRKHVAALEAEKQELAASVGQLTEYRATVEAAQREQALQALRAQFSDLSAEPVYAELMGQSAELGVEAVTEKLYALRGRLGSKPAETFSKAPDPAGLRLDPANSQSAGERHPYGSASKYFPQNN